MKYIKNFKQQHPIILSLLIAVLFAAMLTFSGILTYLLPFIQGAKFEYTSVLASETLVLILVILITIFIGNDYVLKRKGCGFIKGLIPSLYIIILTAFNALSILVNAISESYKIQPLQNILIFILALIAVGITEELVFRGLVAEAIFSKYSNTPAQVWLSVIVSGCIFGFIHLINIQSADTVYAALIQSICASVMGMSYCAIYYRTKNLWVCAFLHTISNTAALSSSGIFIIESYTETLSSYTAINLISCIPYIILTLILLRKSKMATLVKTTKEASRSPIIACTVILTLLFAVAVFAAYSTLPQAIEYAMELSNGSAASGLSIF